MNLLDQNRIDLILVTCLITGETVCEMCLSTKREDNWRYLSNTCQFKKTVKSQFMKSWLLLRRPINSGSWCAGHPALQARVPVSATGWMSVYNVTAAHHSRKEGILLGSGSDRTTQIQQKGHKKIQWASRTWILTMQITFSHLIATDSGDENDQEGELLPSRSLTPDVNPVLVPKRWLMCQEKILSVESHVRKEAAYSFINYGISNHNSSAKSCFHPTWIRNFFHLWLKIDFQLKLLQLRGRFPSVRDRRLSSQDNIKTWGKILCDDGDSKLRPQ
jgi:hypothetical protein